MARGVYIHIPFCHQICNYCDFNKVFFKNQPVDEYIEALGTEMKLWSEDKQAFSHIETIFLGGGTPTSLSPTQLSRLLTLIKTYIPMEHVTEFTSEANPDELTKEKLEVLYKGGVNRISLGVQAFQPELLKKLGRTHSNEHVFETLKEAKKVGFTNISIDLMYGLPGQTVEEWKATLEVAFGLNLPHYSAYSLIVESKTIFYNLMNKGKLSLPGEDLEADMYDILMQQMEEHGFHQYEISNFSKDGHSSIHNRIYWDNDEYAGFGAGAHGYVNGIRYSNHAPLKKYISSLEAGEKPILKTHVVTQDEKMEEEMFLGLRKTAGISKKHFQAKFNCTIESVYSKKLKLLVSAGLLSNDEAAVKLTKKGRFVGNEVFEEFLL
ncbi:oxygen-independent coproporphyrinogen III oxidase [Viridibacillus sp. YIM B01967]|uniref:Heme chaperone HemW n=1 Tax=Viridibacillus soli TaxID=2798301 RepID=A0ABS1H202_9BACL|nr:radical SAM family heme chaperone HemW [Viridibacillus soli]MBK3493341.1 oxygen-independent coproporphyrinogen III oxidase [Viridibacillus soli]